MSSFNMVVPQSERFKRVKRVTVIETQPLAWANESHIDLAKLKEAIAERLAATGQPQLAVALRMSYAQLGKYRDGLVTKMYPKTARKFIAFFGEEILK